MLKSLSPFGLNSLVDQEAASRFNITYYTCIEVNELLYSLVADFWKAPSSYDGFLAGVVADKLEEDIDSLVTRYSHLEEELYNILEWFRRRSKKESHNMVT
jgi:hypothetical protein